MLDDFDKPLKSDDMVNFLKAITDTYSRRIISMPRRKIMSSGDDQTSESTPESFEYTGKLIIITNLKRDDIDRALLSRIPTLEVAFDSKTVIDATSKMLKFLNPAVPMKIKEEVFVFIKQYYLKHPEITLSFRTFAVAIDARVGDPENWKDMLKYILV